MAVPVSVPDDVKVTETFAAVPSELEQFRVRWQPSRVCVQVEPSPVYEDAPAFIANALSGRDAQPDWDEFQRIVQDPSTTKAPHFSVEVDDDEQATANTASVAIVASARRETLPMKASRR